MKKLKITRKSTMIKSGNRSIIQVKIQNYYVLSVLNKPLAFNHISMHLALILSKSRMKSFQIRNMLMRVIMISKT